MQSLWKSKPAFGGREIAPAIYIPLVDSLYQEARTLLVGYFMVTGPMLLTWWKTGDLALLACAIAFTAVALWRALDMRAYARVRDAVKSTEQAQRWEIRYGAGAASSLAILGLWCALSLAQADDASAGLVSFSITVAYVIGITGRNFGSSRLVLVQIMSVAVPMIGGLVARWQPFYLGYVPFLGMFFLAVWFICERLRSNLLEAVTSEHAVSLLAQRFDAALTNMPHGLCMFDADRQIVVANRKLNECLGLPWASDLKSIGISDLAAKCVRMKQLSSHNAERLVQCFNEQLPQHTKRKFSIELEDKRILEFTLESMENSGMVAVVEDITVRKHAEARIHQMAHFDSLTELPNRAILQRRLDEAIARSAHGQACAVHFIDLDRFKQVNDTLGHSRGDRLLHEVARRLSDAVGKAALVARFGGDEFIVLQQEIADERDAAMLADQILRSIRTTYNIDENEVAMSASVGVALAPQHGNNTEEILRNADMALYHAKAASRDTWRFFKSEMEAMARERRSVELDLRNALANEEFEVYYQPIIELSSGRILACEALLRWPRREHGIISPGDFIPIAEEMGMIAELDQWVLKQACVECRRWPGDIHVAVNLSSIEFSRGNVPHLVRDTLSASGLAPHRLEIEITETTLLQDTAKSRAALRRLERMGVRVSLDDFGTKYSSLSYLHSFPLHKVKIDQSFVRNIAGNARMMTLLRGIARLSAELGLRVAVEGIETVEQLELVASHAKVDEVQGYLFGIPMPASGLRTLLQTTIPLRLGDRVA
jgi:diguanylate cyclase (GGDEF)-like protein